MCTGTEPVQTECRTCSRAEPSDQGAGGTQHRHAESPEEPGGSSHCWHHLISEGTLWMYTFVSKLILTCNCSAGTRKNSSKYIYKQKDNDTNRKLWVTIIFLFCWILSLLFCHFYPKVSVFYFLCICVPDILHFSTCSTVTVFPHMFGPHVFLNSSTQT